MYRFKAGQSAEHHFKRLKELKKGVKMKIVITVENEEHKQAIIDLLESAENDGNLDFVFNVEIKGA